MAERVQQSPYGDIIFANTPKIDQMGALLYNQEKQREAMRQKKAELLDAEMAKGASKLRDADVEGYYDRYNNYKQAWMDLQKTNPKGKEFLQKQTALNQLKADMDAYGNKSTAFKQREILTAKDINKDDRAYINEAQDLLYNMTRLPMDDPNYESGYKAMQYGGNRTNFLPYIQKSIGQASPSTLSTFETPIGDTQMQKNKITGINKTAPEIATAFLSQVAGARMSGDLTKAFRDYTPDYEQKINADYDAMVNSELYQKAYKGKRMDFPEYMSETPQGKIAMLVAKEAALQNAPRELKEGNPYTLSDKKRAVDFDTWKKKNEITYRQSLVKIAANRSGATAGYNETTGNSLDEIHDTETQNGKKIVDGAVFNEDGTPYSSPKGIADIYVTKDNLPANLLASLKAGGIGDISKGVNIEVKDGVVVGLQTKYNGYISRLAVENAQKKLNTEPLKAAQPKFGAGNNTVPSPKKQKKVTDPNLLKQLEQE